MEKKSKIVVVSNETPISKSTYYFTNGEVFKLKSYSRLVFYGMLFSVILLIGRAAEGIDHSSLLIACGIIFAILLFVVLWIAPKERRMSAMSLDEVKDEASAKKIDESLISNLKVDDKHVSFDEGNAKRWGKIGNGKKEDVDFLKSRFGV